MAVTDQPVPPGPRTDQPVTQVAANRIRVELSAAVDGWPTHSRFDVVLRGQITSAAPVDSFTINDPAGLELVAVQFGHGDDQVTVLLSGGDTAFRAGFQVYLPMPGGDAVRISDMWVRARARDGAVFEEGMRLGCMADQAAILAGPAHDMPGTEIAAPRGMVYLESAEITADRRLLVHGWALATSPVVAVQIFVDGRRVGAAMQGRERGDVADAYPDWPNARLAGFVLERVMDEAMRGAANVTAQVLCLSGACHATTIPLSHAAEPPAATVSVLETKPPGAAESKSTPPTSQAPPANSLDATRPEPARPEPAAGKPENSVLLNCDHAIVTADGGLLIEGWAASRQGIERVAIEVDGRPAGNANYGRDRPDVAMEHNGIPVGTGFDFAGTIPGFTGGSHEVRVIAIGRDGDRSVLTVTAAAPPAAAFRFELDGPVTRDGVMVHPVTGRLVIEGWALARDGMTGIDVELDGTLLGHAHYGMARPDVGAVFPDWAGSARSGYTFHCPSRALPDGDHVIQLIARSKTGGSHVHAFRITVKKTDDPEEAASIRRRVKWVEQKTTNGVLDQLNWRPAFHLIVTGDPTVAANDKAWALTVRSIVEQCWPNWRVTVVASGGPDAEAALTAIGRLAHEHTARFTVADPSGAAAWRAPFVSQSESAAGGQASSSGASDSGASVNGVPRNEPSLIALLAAGDELGRDALSAFAVASGIHPRADCFYADEFRLAPGATRPEAFFKPDFSPSLLLSTNYIGRPLVLRPALLATIGATAESLMRDGFHDLALRCTEAAAHTYHVTELLSRTDGGVAVNPDNGAAALRDAMARRGIDAEVLPGAVPETFQVRRTAPAGGKVSIIIPTCAAKGYIETCLRTLRAVTTYRNYEIVCIDNIPETETTWKRFVREHADKVVEMPAPFNWSRFNNTAAAAADGEFLLFLNDDIEIVQPDWLDAMLETAAWPGVGIVGARLLYPDRTVQHAGMFLGDGIGRHAFRHAAETDPGYFGLARMRREVIGVTGACLLVRRDIFGQLGRFDEAHDVINNDLDFCLRAHRAGLRTIYTPHATLIHHERVSRETMAEDFDAGRFTGAWRGLFAAGDPYFNPRLSRCSDDYRVDDEGVRALYGGHPLIDRAAVKAILVVKVDHIGDFITALPAIRRLKTVFPNARLTALVAPASAAIAAVEPAIDECIPFEFFFERSELGEKELTEAELAGLTARLAPYRFDIAVDLRKNPSTRNLLLCAGAKVLAGYDSLESYPWLDVVLEWEGDKALQRKRSHAVDDLVKLVAAIDVSCDADRRLFDPVPTAMAVEELPEGVRHLFVRPVVAIHPGSGNVMRQWPERHIPPLIQLLLERDDVAVMLVGGRDDEAKAANILAQVARPDRVASAVSQVPLRDLPRLLAACTLFIGGDSGPKHIAAASGVPTIGMHSGVVDPAEWGPMGERAVALYRDMSCAPCFLAKTEHCPRGLACVELLDPALVHQTARMFLARPVNDRIEPERPALRTPAVAALTGTQSGKPPPGKRSEKQSGSQPPGKRSGKQARTPASRVVADAALAGKQSRKRVQRMPAAEPK
jgi:ADP-heptose:LPS heptosyltransferase/GT2 family glycosyltransferase